MSRCQHINVLNPSCRVVIFKCQEWHVTVLLHQTLNAVQVRLHNRLDLTWAGKGGMRAPYTQNSQKYLESHDDNKAQSDIALL